MFMGASPEVATKLTVFLAGISRGEWIQLWAGLLGAIPAAVISAAVAALVAVMVLGRSNRHQHELSERALNVQRDLARLQLKDQKDLNDAQLDEQRNEVAKAREKDAIAVVLAETYGFIEAANGSLRDVSQQLLSFRSAAFRWQLELDTTTPRPDLWMWASLLFQASLELVSSRQGAGGNEDEIFPIVSTGVVRLSEFALGWQSNPAARRTTVAAIEELRIDLEAKLAAYNAKHPETVEE
jgi:hypothetical protein